MLTFIGGVIAFVIAAIYLSMVDIASASVLQCYLIDLSANGRVDYANDKIKELLVDSKKELEDSMKEEKEEEKDGKDKNDKDKDNKDSKDKGAQ